MTYLILFELFSKRIHCAANSSLEETAITKVVVSFWEAGQGQRKGKDWDF